MCRQLRTLFFACENIKTREINAETPLTDAIRYEWSTLRASTEEFPFNERAIQMIWDFVVSMSEEERKERLQHYDSEEQRLLKEIEENGDGPQLGAITIYG